MADKALQEKSFNFAKNSKHDAYQTSLAPTVYKFFVKKTLGVAVEIMQNQQLAEELHKHMTRKFEKQLFN